jgi:dihydrofolate synthase/folylpolyglutamate synthase
MRQIRNITEAEQALAEYMPQVRELLGKDITLVRMEPLLTSLGNPQAKLKIIHVAGTSGKTSTSYYVASLLKVAGKKAGLTVSPHLDSVTERVQINLDPLAEDVFCQSLGEFLELIKNVDPRPTYFELVIAFVYWYFAKAQVDYAVIETGLGGTFDATNMAKNSNKVCVITDIGIDHTHVLGNSLPEIAGQKAGIIQAQNQVFMHDQSPAVMEVFHTKANKEKAILNVLSNLDNESREAENPSFSALPEYQQRNWLLAKRVYDYLAQRDALPTLNNDQQTASMAVQVPGRMDVRGVNDKTIVMDGAHNEQKMTAFVSSFKKLYPNQKAAILLSLKEGKEHEAVLPIIKPICSSLIITTFLTAQDLPAVSIHPDILAAAAQKYGFNNVSVDAYYKTAYQQLLATDEPLAIITGSFYLLSTLRPIILNDND